MVVINKMLYEQEYTEFWNNLEKYMGGSWSVRDVCQKFYELGFNAGVKQAEEGQWQPIETMPEAGNYFVINLENQKCTTLSKTIYTRLLELDVKSFAMTHWQKIPEPVREEIAEESLSWT